MLVRKGKLHAIEPDRRLGAMIQYSAMVYEHTPALDPGVYSSIHIDSAGGKKPDPDDLMPRLCAICIPHAGVEYERAARNADVIITETGGKLAHMATVARESGRLLIRVDNACDRLPPFTKINFNMTRQTMEITRL